MAGQLKTVREQLIEVQEAISAVMNSQKYDVAGRSLTRADLGDLQDREEWLLKKANAGQLDKIPGAGVSKGAYGVSFGA